ncbi:hypothetical protein K435DRAFT_822655 [Dendrothele bispora CBS 962.96]|uniref:DUF6533 domain-containing protein n=1 Tax=Dendrothele bispora (strain CBS 962.96) TaxID=1314807 RepID=A0A4S8L7R7_DENBC|nr:hypothetical protein K435DRAFT_822655 [Dendrothele bispora CBS 962.96]
MSSAASKAATHYLQFDIQWSSIALIFYDYALTLPMEVKYMWGAKYQNSVVLYIFCRYALLANVLYVLAISGRLNTRVSLDFPFRHRVVISNFCCYTTYKLIGALSVLGRAAVILIFILRTYVIFARSRIILAYLSILGAACVALDIMRRIFEHSHVCRVHTELIFIIDGGFLLPANELLSIFMVVFEYSAAILTTVRCIQAFRAEGSPWKARKDGLRYMVFEQGRHYVVSLITTAAVVLNFSGFLQRLLNAYLLPLSGLLSARFLLHLRKWKAKDTGLRNGTSNDASGAIGTFRAVSGVVASIDEFGEDPVALGSSTAAGGLRLGSDSEKRPHHETEIDQLNPRLEIDGTVSESSGGSVEFLGSVKEGKKPIHAA